jgi:hypothetical protein
MQSRQYGMGYSGHGAGSSLIGSALADIAMDSDTNPLDGMARHTVPMHT